MPRVLPAGRRAVIRKGSWPVPPVFSWIQKLGGVDEAEMFRPAWEIGEVVEGETGVELREPEA